MFNILLIMVILSVGFWNRKLEGFEVHVSLNADVVVTLCTSPKRIDKIKPVIDSILNQTIKPDKIVLNLPFVFKRHNSRFGKIPGFLKNNSRVYINWCDDIGPATKVLPTVKIVRPFTNLISIDDDIVYPPDTIASLLEMSKLYPEAAITGHSRMLLEKDDSLQHRRDKTKLQLAELVEGHASVLYKREFLLDFDYDDILTTPKSCFLGDDFTISNHLRKKKIPIIVIKDILDTIYSTSGVLDYGLESDAIHLGADGTQQDQHDYEACAAHLRDNNNLYIKHYG